MAWWSQLTTLITADNILRFPTQKYIIVKDKKLGAAFIFLNVVVIVYLFNMIWFTKAYLTTRVPTIASSIWVTTDDATTTDRRQDLEARQLCSCQDNPQPEICTSYEHSLQDSTTHFENFGCVQLSTELSTLTASRQIFVATAVQERQRFGVVTASQEGCPATLANQPFAEYRGRACMYDSKQTWLNTDAESVVINLNHRYLSDNYMHSVDDLDCEVRQAGASQWSSRNAPVMKLGQANATLAQWLQWGEVDLDRLVNDQAATATLEVSPDSSGKYPMLRVSGVELRLHVQYFNWGYTTGTSLSSRLKCVIEVEAALRPTRSNLMDSMYPGTVLGGESMLSMYESRWRPPGSSSPIGNVTFTAVTRTASGVRVVVETGGRLGSFSLTNLVVTITSGLVLSQLANMFCQLLACFCLGAKSRCYFMVLRQEVDVARIFARYALRAMSASLLYRQVDDDHSNGIDALEMFPMLKDIFTDNFDDVNLIALTDFVMSTVSKQQGTRLNFMSEKLTRVAFMELFTDDDMNMPTMRGLLKLFYKQKQDEYESHKDVLLASWKQSQAAAEKMEGTKEEGEQQLNTAASIARTTDEKARRMALRTLAVKTDPQLDAYLWRRSSHALHRRKFAALLRQDETERQLQAPSMPAGVDHMSFTHPAGVPQLWNSQGMAHDFQHSTAWLPCQPQWQQQYGRLGGGDLTQSAPTSLHATQTAAGAGETQPSPSDRRHSDAAQSAPLMPSAERRSSRQQGGQQHSDAPPSATTTAGARAIHAAWSGRGAVVVENVGLASDSQILGLLSGFPGVAAVRSLHVDGGTRVVVVYVQDSAEAARIVEHVHERIRLPGSSTVVRASVVKDR